MLHDDEKSAKSKFFTLDIGWYLMGFMVGIIIGQKLLEIL